MRKVFLIIILLAPLICLAQFGTDNKNEAHLILTPAEQSGQWWVEVSDKEQFKNVKAPLLLTVSLQRPKPLEAGVGEVYDVGTLPMQNRSERVLLWVPLDQLKEPGNYFLVVEAFGYSRSWWLFSLSVNNE